MIVLVTILVALVSVALIFIILIQNPKGGGVSSAFGGAQVANNLLGAARAGDAMERLTWGLSGALLILCLVSFLVFPKATNTTGAPGVNTETTTNTAPLPNNGGAPMPNGGGAAPTPNGGTTTPPTK